MHRLELVFLSLFVALSVHAQNYDLGSPTVTDLWVDPVNGDDARTGATRALAMRTVAAAWIRIPSNQTLTGTGYRMMLVAGTYERASLPNYWELRRGTAQFPVILQAADGRGTAILRGDINMATSSFVYFIDLNLEPQPAGDTLHLERSDHILVRGCRLNGGTWPPAAGGSVAHDNLKVNQSQYIYVEEIDVSGADDNAVDYVAVQYGWLVRSKIHNANDWCAYAKGGSASLLVAANEIYDCGTGGYTAGQGTGFQFMTPPFLHYETVDVKVVNNVIHDVEGAGLGANGSYNALFAYNTLYRTGTRSHLLELGYGARGCDGVVGQPPDAGCVSNLAAGGWGTTRIDDGTNFARVPNKHVYVYDNLFYNPPGVTSSQLLAVLGPYSGPNQAGSNIPTPTLFDDDVRMRGNLVFNGGSALEPGIGDDSGCQPSNPTCNAMQLAADNVLGGGEPQLVNPAGGDFRPVAGGNLTAVPTFAPPSFPGGDRPQPPLAPAGDLMNVVATDRAGAARTTTGPPGAYTVTGSDGGGGGTGPCATSGPDLCLQQSRFRLGVSWKNPYDGGTTGVGTAVGLTTDTGYFWFFQSTNVELIIKVLDGRGINGKFWVFYGALSDVEYTLTVTDTATGAVKTYHNAPRTLTSASDIQAF